MAYFNGTTLISKDLAEIYDVKIASQKKQLHLACPVSAL
jgi:hypothetical protein